MIALKNIPLNKITESPANPRRYFSPESLAELTASVREQGVLQPILVRPFNDGYQIVAGARRFRASVAAEKSDIPAVVREMDDTAALEATIIENLQREDVHPLEEAEGYERLMKDAGFDADQLADKVGKSRSYIYGRLKLLDLCLDARDAFYESKLDASTALLVARIPSQALQKKAVKELVSGYNGEPLSYRTAKRHVQDRFMLNLKDATFRPTDAALVPEAGSCTKCPKRTGSNPDLFGDIDSANVCTDPDCFNNKRQAHYMKLKENAEKKGIQVIQGKAALAIAPQGTHFLRGDYVNLNSICHEDEQRRTYREILGKAAPIEALVENNGWDKNKIPLIEVASQSAIQQALDKIGFKPQGEEEETPEEKAERKQYEAERAEKERSQTIEKRWRVRLFELVREKTAARLAQIPQLGADDLRALAVGLFIQLAGLGSDDIDRVMEMWGYQDEDQKQTYEEDMQDFVTRFINQMDAPGLALFLFDMALISEVAAHRYFDTEPPARLLAEAARNGIDAEAIKAEISAAATPPGKAKNKKSKKDSPSTPAAQADKVIAEKAEA